MEHDAFEWKDEYRIGVDAIDNAHKQLFSIVNRIIRNFMDKNFEKNRTTCIEAIKYLKSYTIKHFSEEEDYQLSIGYAGYKTHKKIHDNMRTVVIPALEKEIMAKSFSKEALEHFVGVCAGWLAAHVLIEDQAITGKTKSKWKQDYDDKSETALDKIVRSYVKALFRMNASLVSKNYSGHKLNKPFCYTDVFIGADGASYTVITAIEESMLEVVASRLMDSEFFVLDAVMLPVVSEMLKSFNLEVMMAFLNDSLTETSSRVISKESFYETFESSYPDHTVLWRTDYGYIVFCVRKN